MRIAIEERTPDENTRFSNTAFDRQVGSTVAFSVDGHQLGEATLMRAVVEDEGKKATLLFDIPDDPAIVHLLGVGEQYSLSVAPVLPETFDQLHRRVRGNLPY